MAAVSPAKPASYDCDLAMASTLAASWLAYSSSCGDDKGPVDLLVELDRRSEQPLYAQLEHRLRAAIRDGRLRAGARLPSSRGLAAELGISRGVVTSAYDQLAAEGYLDTRQGAPVRVWHRTARRRGAGQAMI